MKEIVQRFGLDDKNKEKGLHSQQFHLGGHLKIYIDGETLSPINTPTS